MLNWSQLRDLRYGDSSETNESRYEEQLGRKEHFFLHAMLAVLSYLVFGLIPPVIYGFTFRESDDRDYKILAVAAASLLCIVILAIAKAYTRGEHKSWHTSKPYCTTLPQQCWSQALPMLWVT